MNLRQMLRLAPVIPVLTIEDAQTAVPLAQALVTGGLRVLEVTLRSPAALTSIRRICTEVEGVVVAAGTVLNRRDLEAVAQAGARFAVSPGLTDLAFDGPIPVLPGVATASEVMRGMDGGLATFKLFPAAPAGGVALLKAFAPPFPTVAFCPTGGVNEANARSFLDLSNVLCVGGSWVAPIDAVRSGDWPRIRALAQAAVALGEGIEGADLK